MARGRGGSATAEWREPASSDRLPTHRSESPTGYSSAGCSPAEPASASPVTDNISPIPIPASQSKFLCSTSLPVCTQTRAPRALANRVSSLLCTPGDISILRRQGCGGSKHHLLHLIQTHDVVSPVIQLCCPGALVRRHLLRLLQIPAVGQVDGDPGRPESVAADLRLDTRLLRPPLGHPEGIIPRESLRRKPGRLERRGSK